MFGRYITTGFDYHKTFEHLSLPIFISILLIGVPLFSLLFSFLLSQLFKLASIQISNSEITGRNYFWLKKTIPFSDISGLSNYSNNGINAIVVNSKNHGKIYIYKETERLEEIIAILEAYSKQNYDITTKDRS
jgi:hypothetical protein